jgi:hypothetical protein
MIKNKLSIYQTEMNSLTLRTYEKELLPIFSS